MAFTQYSRRRPAMSAAAELARRTYRNILHRRDNPKGVYTKADPGHAPAQELRAADDPVQPELELEHLLEPAEVEATIDLCLHEVLEVFFDREREHRLRERRAGRHGTRRLLRGPLLNPGHAIEAMWFIMDIGRRRKDRALIEKATDIAL